MKLNIKDIMMDHIIKIVKNHIESYVYDKVTIGDIEQALNYNFGDDVIEYALNNGIMKKLYMMKYDVKSL
ncbi:MAG: hypothetical protein EOM11_10445 [Erysipelotrichia bacterium]|nr:hypothetical protein [Erysipelotrichia bacterium]